MVGSVLIQGKNYGIFDFFAAVLMSVGIVFFTLADSEVSPNFDVRGVGMICIALAADAIIGNVQEKAMKSHQASNVEVVFYSYSIGLLYLFVGSFLFGNLIPAIKFCAEYPKETYGYAFIFSVTGYFGIQLVLNLIRLSGAFVAVTVTTLRKMVSIVISFLLFNKPFTLQYAWAGSLVVLGIYLNVYSKKLSTFSVKKSKTTIQV
uniref:Adenosine 3'-phospho 5'-phosphosulfate transporter 2 n=1 Tax=Strigamia maritima TaxID=126957 RepID=T1J0A4_STRMM